MNVGSLLSQYAIPFIELGIALAAFILVCRFVGKLFRRTPPEEPEEGEPFAGVTAPLAPRTPRKRARATAEIPEEPDDQS